MSLPLFSPSGPALHVCYQPVDQLDAVLADPATLAVFRFAAADAAADALYGEYEQEPKHAQQDGLQQLLRGEQ